MEIFNYPLYYIGFDRENTLEKKLKYAGFTNVNHFKAINGRNFNIKQLLKDKTISTRSYIDLKYGRSQHSGIPSLGAIGCTMSHYSLWKKCIESNFPYIIIIEDDVNIPDKIDEKQLKYITNILKKEKNGYISTRNKKLDDFFHCGTHFCILSKEVCKELVKDAFPMEIQTDAYIWHKHNIGDINIEKNDYFSTSNSFLNKNNRNNKNFFGSTTQDECFKCLIPSSLKTTKVLPFLLFVILIILFIYIFYIKCVFFNKCKNN